MMTLIVTMTTLGVEVWQTLLAMPNAQPVPVVQSNVLTQHHRPPPLQHPHSIIHLLLQELLP